MKFYLLVLILVLSTLSGCDTSKSYAQLCKENKEICYEFHEDSWCKKERIKVGMSSLEHVTKPEDMQKFNLLIAYEDYETCVEHAAKIEHIKLKEKKTRRIENMMKARKRIKELSDQTINSEHPRLLYFHWTRYLNEDALEKFLALEGTKNLETPESQHELATYYAKIDIDKTLQLLFHALELHQPGKVINVEIFKSLSSIFSDKKKVKQAYIWLKVLQLYSPEDEDISEGTLSNFAVIYKLDSGFLDKVATSTLNKIETNTFIPPKF